VFSLQVGFAALAERIMRFAAMERTGIEPVTSGLQSLAGGLDT